MSNHRTFDVQAYLSRDYNDTIEFDVPPDVRAGDILVILPPKRAGHIAMIRLPGSRGPILLGAMTLTVAEEAGE